MTPMTVLFLTFRHTIISALLIIASVKSFADIPTQQKTNEIVWAFWGDPWEVEVVNNIIKVFEFENPDISIKTRHVTWEHYFDAAHQWFSSNSPPDVLFLSHIEPYAAKGHLLPLNAYIKYDKYDTADFHPPLLDLFKYRGNIYGFPRDNDTKVIFYNRKHFADAGIAHPECDWNWNQLKYAADRLTDRAAGKYGIIHNHEWLRLLLMQSEAENHSQYEAEPSQQANIEAVNWFSRLIRDNSPVRSFQVSSKHAATLFKKQRVSMVFGNHALVPSLLDEKHLDWGVVCLPKNKRKVNKIGGAGYVISKKTRNPEAAWRFLKWLSGARGQAIFTESGAIFPARQSIAHSPVFKNLVNAHHARVFIEEIRHSEAEHLFYIRRKNSIVESTRLVNLYVDGDMKFDSTFKQPHTKSDTMFTHAR